MSNIRKATRKKAKVRLGLSSVSGGGKTKTALLIAYGICGDWNKITIIDAENGSGDWYSHLGPYNIRPLLPPFTPERYIEAIQEAESDAEVEVIIVDTMSQEWEGPGGILQEVDTIGGGFQTAWKAMTPRHDRFIQAILHSRCHMITTTRRKTEYVIVEAENAKGKTVQKPVKAGTKEITREGWEYELTINLHLDMNHMAIASKDRTGLFMGKDPFIPSEETGRLIAEWCNTGIDPAAELKVILEKIALCNTVDELMELRNTSSPIVTSMKEFKDAANAQYAQVKPAQVKPAQVKPAQQQPAAATPPVQQDQAAPQPAQPATPAPSPQQPAADPAKPPITEIHLQQVCARIKSGDLTAYDSSLQAFTFDELQKQILDACINTARDLTARLQKKYTDDKELREVVNLCTRTDQIMTLHTNNALIMERTPGLMDIVNERLRTLRQAATPTT